MAYSNLLSVFLLLISGRAWAQAAKFTTWDDPNLVAIREHVIKAWGLRPEPENLCELNNHKAAVRLYTQILSNKEQEEMLMDMQYSVVNMKEDYYMGIGETIGALSSSKIKYMLYWDSLYINSATYRNPLSGRTITLHTMYSPSTYIALNYTEPETGCFMQLITCHPFPKWVSKFYKRFVPRITRLDSSLTNSTNRNFFLRMSEGVGGRFTEMVPFGDNRWLVEVIQMNSIRKTILLKGTIPSVANPTNAENNEYHDETNFEGSSPSE